MLPEPDPQGGAKFGSELYSIFECGSGSGEKFFKYGSGSGSYHTIQQVNLFLKRTKGNIRIGAIFTMISIIFYYL
jgi:hypothetical protein